MNLNLITVDADIRRAETLPGAFYADAEVYALQRERVFARGWHFAAAAEQVAAPGTAYPFELLPGCLNESLALVRGTDNTLRCISNVCTHRGNLIVNKAGPVQKLRCRYHGRRFHLDGRFEFMPEFEDAENFPRPEDNLRTAAVAEWRGLIFVSLDPAMPFAEWIAPVEARLGGLLTAPLRFDAAGVAEYEVRANWALYCDNYLEEFHIPFVHPGLSQAIEYNNYATIPQDHWVLQAAQARAGEPAFAPPPGHPEAGRAMAAFYYWMFPNQMLNFYPWGLSLNVVMPRGVDSTRVRFLPFVLDDSLRGKGAGGDLDQVEREDEAVVESVQRGLLSRYYTRGRYSPARETGVHHFHRMLLAALRD